MVLHSEGPNKYIINQSNKDLIKIISTWEAKEKNRQTVHIVP